MNLFDHSPADTFLLAAFGAEKTSFYQSSRRILDLGCGSGRLLYEHHLLFPRDILHGLEIQPSLLDEAIGELSSRGVSVRVMNQCSKADASEGEVILTPGDVCSADAYFESRMFDWIYLNPPYFNPDQGRIPTEPIRAIYRHEMTAKLEDFLQACHWLLSPEGEVLVIYPADRMERFQSALGLAAPLKVRQYREVYPNPDASQAVWILSCLTLSAQPMEAEWLEPVRNPDTYLGALRVRR